MTLHSFSGDGEGRAPYDGLVQGANGTLFGSTMLGGIYGGGTLYSVDRQGVFTTRHHLGGGAEGSWPWGNPLVNGKGTVVGLTINGGAYGFGTAYKVTPSGKTTVLHDFTGYLDGYTPQELTRLPDGRYVGATHGSRQPGLHGSIFSIGADGSFDVRHTFSADQGSGSASPLLLSSDGNLYGVRGEGGGVRTCWYGCGTLFRLAPDGTFTVLYRFQGGRSGSYPWGHLVEGEDGALYGTAQRSEGVAGAHGTVFKLTKDGTLTTLHVFDGSDGGEPYGLVKGRDGALYGAAGVGGANSMGTLYRITPAGDFTLLHSFSGPDGNIAANLMQAADGTFYGTTVGGGAFDNGTVFRYHLHVKTDPPTMSPAAGTYSPGQTVTLASDVPGARIFYTLDGSKPSVESLRYTGPITLNASTTIRAMARLHGDLKSTEISGRYAIKGKTTDDPGH